MRIIEHQAHAPGHAALLIEDRGLLVAGDMLSEIVMPFLDLDAADPIEDYLAALRLFENVGDDVDAVIPGHGSVGGAGQLRARIAQDRAYLRACEPTVTPTIRASVQKHCWTGCPRYTDGNDTASMHGGTRASNYLTPVDVPGPAAPT